MAIAWLLFLGLDSWFRAGDAVFVRNDLILVLVVITALCFDFTNGFHDTGNAMATSIATGALDPGSRSVSPPC